MTDYYNWLLYWLMIIYI